MSKALQPPSDKDPQHHFFDKDLPKISDKKQTGHNQKSAFSYKKAFFRWLGELIAEQASSEIEKSKEVTPLKEMHLISVRESPSEVVSKAELIYANLSEIKNRLLSQFGGSTSSSFIIKSIEPMMSQARRLIDDLNNQDQKTDRFQDLLEQAVASVELYSQFSDETKIKKKIIHEAYQFTKLSIDKDIEVLSNYKLHALEIPFLSSGEKEGQNNKLDRFLEPIFNELRGIHHLQLETPDLEGFFNWKISVDERRASLIELGFLTIDALTSAFKGEELPEIDQESEKEVMVNDSSVLEGQVEEYSLELSFLATIEDRAHNCFELLDRILPGDQGSLWLVEQLLEDLKLDAEQFVNWKMASPKMREDFEVLGKLIKKTESLLENKKQITEN